MGQPWFPSPYDTFDVGGLQREELADGEMAEFKFLVATDFHMENDWCRRTTRISSIPPDATTRDFAHVIHSDHALEEAYLWFMKDHQFYTNAQWLQDFDAAVLATIENIARHGR